MSACSLKLGGAEEPLPLVGESASVTQFQRLNQDSVGSYYVMTDEDGGVWALIFETAPGESDANADGEAIPHRRLRLVRLDRPAQEELIEANLIAFGKHVLYAVDYAAAMDQPTHVRVLRPGHGGHGIDITIAAVGGAVSTGNRDEVFLFYTTERVGESRQIVVRSDGSYQRVIPPRRKPKEGAPLLGNSTSSFDASGSYLIRQQPDGQLIFYSTRDEKEDLDLGIQDWFWGTDDVDPVFYTCDRKGLKRVPFDKSPPTVLDTAACWVIYFRAFQDEVANESRTRTLLYTGPHGYFMVSSLGGPIEKLELPDEAWLLALNSQHQGAYTLTVNYQYTNQRQDTMTDGWIGDWQFMTRGYDVDFSKDGARLRWLENAARTDNTGDLRSVRVADGPQSMRLLSRNVYDYGRLRDGRLLAVSNAANYNQASRIILIDQDEQVARRVVENAHSYKTIPGSNDILVTTWTGARGVDVYRVPLPTN